MVASCFCSFSSRLMSSLLLYKIDVHTHLFMTWQCQVNDVVRWSEWQSVTLTVQSHAISRASCSVNSQARNNKSVCASFVAISICRFSEVERNPPRTQSIDLSFSYGSWFMDQAVELYVSVCVCVHVHVLSVTCATHCLCMHCHSAKQKKWERQSSTSRAHQICLHPHYLDHSTYLCQVWFKYLNPDLKY